MIQIANFDPLAAILFRAEISFLITLTVFASLHVAQIYVFRLQAPTRAGFHAEEFVDRPQGCSSSSLLQADDPSIITRLSFTVLD